MFFSSIPTSSSGWAYGQLIPLTKEIWVGDGFQGKRTLLTFLSSNKVILSSMQFTQFCQFQSTKKFNLHDYWYLKCAFAANEQSKCVFLLLVTNASMRTNLRLLENLKRLHFWQLWQRRSEAEFAIPQNLLHKSHQTPSHICPKKVHFW